ncbi:hypothetical protein [Streptomyces sp. NPDC059743]|uniref:hypothetical protein n=1 Tax=Streptomyces sp. NPDC059743 TaxID=3346928 RepID=UPI00364AD479
MVDALYAEAAIDGGLLLRRGTVDRAGDVAEAGDKCLIVPTAKLTGGATPDADLISTFEGSRETAPVRPPAM